MQPSMHPHITPRHPPICSCSKINKYALKKKANQKPRINYENSNLSFIHDIYLLVGVVVRDVRGSIMNA
jgi:hypothetical protein